LIENPITQGGEFEFHPTRKLVRPQEPRNPLDLEIETRAGKRVAFPQVAKDDNLRVGKKRVQPNFLEPDDRPRGVRISEASVRMRSKSDQEASLEQILGLKGKVAPPPPQRSPPRPLYLQPLSSKSPLASPGFSPSSTISTSPW